MMERKEQVVNKLTSGVEHLLKKNGVKVIKGWGELTGANEITVKGAEVRKLKAENIILATGSKPILPPIPGKELPGVIS